MPKLWKPIVGYEGSYLVSNHGDVLSLKDQFGRSRKLLRKPTVDRKTNYVRITLYKKEIGDTIKYVHRLVAEAFLNKEEGKNYVNHIDSNRSNNNVDNLEWCTQSHNIQHGYKQGNIKPTRHRLNKSTSKNKFKLIYFEKSRQRWVAAVEQTNNPKNKLVKTFSVKKFGAELAELKAAQAVNSFLDILKDSERTPNIFTKNQLQQLNKESDND